MLKKERFKKILKTVKASDFAKVNDLSDELNVSVVTIRRDLQELEDQGLLIRSHGGAKDISYLSNELNYETRRKKNNPIKREIAEQAINFVKEGMVVLLDAGSTNYILATLIIDKNISDLTIITNDIHIVNLFFQHKQFKLIFLGGTVVPEIGNTQGLLTKHIMETLQTDIAFIGASCIGENLKIYSPTEEKVELKRLFMTNTDKSIALVDDSKFLNKGMYYITDLTALDGLITNKKFTASQLALIGESLEIIDSSAL